MADTRTITLVGGPYSLGDAERYGPGEVTVPTHLADVLEMMDQPAREQDAGTRETARAERKQAAEDRATARKA